MFEYNEVCDYHKWFVVTTQGLRLQWKVCDYEGRFLNATRFVITTDGLLLQHKVCDCNRIAFTIND